MSRGGDSNYDNRTCNNRSPAFLISEQVKKGSVYDSRENEMSVTHDYP